MTSREGKTNYLSDNSNFEHSSKCRFEFTSNPAFIKGWYNIIRKLNNMSSIPHVLLLTLSLSITPNHTSVYPTIQCNLFLLEKVHFSNLKCPQRVSGSIPSWVTSFLLTAYQAHMVLYYLPNFLSLKRTPSWCLIHGELHSTMPFTVQKKDRTPGREFKMMPTLKWKWKEKNPKF